MPEADLTFLISFLEVREDGRKSLETKRENERSVAAEQRRMKPTIGGRQRKG